MIQKTHPTRTDIFKSPLIYCICLLASLAVFIIIAHEVVVEKEDWFDSRAFLFFKQYSSPAVISIFKFFTFLGSGPFIFSGYSIIAILLFIKKRKKDALALSGLGVTAFLLVYFLKIFFARDRPHDPLINQLHNFSFPSGHSLGALVFFSVIIYVIWQTALSIYWKWGFTFLLVATILLVGISRIALRFHYASDVVGGFSLGLPLVLLFFYIYGFGKKIKR